MKFLISTVSTALVLPILLRWGRQQSEQRLEQMQLAAYNTPGAEAPIPRAVMFGGAGFLLSHFVVAQKILGLRGWQAIASLLLGAGAGIGIFLNQRGPAR